MRRKIFIFLCMFSVLLAIFIKNPEISASNKNTYTIATERVIGEFKTEFTEYPKGRAFNIKKAANSINNIVVNPGEEFSFNSTLGPTNKARGYKKAKIFINGKDAQGFGGGICQVSSTLFNACDFAGLQILERHDHSKEVSYVEKGRDAATSYGGYDFRFKNNKKQPVIIKATAGKTSVDIKINLIINS